MATYLQVESLTKSFGERVLFKDLSFGIDQSDRIGLIAQNGTGKTTLLEILAGNQSYDQGIITFRKDLRIGYLSQDPYYPQDITVLDACFYNGNDTVSLLKEYENALVHNDTEKLHQLLDSMEAAKAWDYEQRAKQILTRLKIEKLDQPIRELSGGQLKRVALANVLISEPDFLILDEPTNHLDLEMTEWLEEYLNRSNMTLLMVTHDRYFLDRVCNEILEIEDKQLYRYKGNYAYYIEKRQERVMALNSEIDRASNLLRKELDWMRRQPQARGTKAKYRVDAFYGLQDKAQERKQQENIKLAVQASYIGSKIFEIEALSKRYDEKIILNDFSYTFARYEKMGIVGNNGTGKSTFIKMLLGEVKPDSGKIDIGETVRFGYYSQSGLSFNPEQKVIDVVRDIAEEISLGDGQKLSAGQFLQHFLFTPEKQYGYVSKLSGGERRRLYLCTILITNPNFLVLDEPTNDLDILTLNILEEYLQQFKGCLIVVSHDRYFMDKVVDHLLVFNGQGLLKDFPGNYTQYREWKEEQTRMEKETAPKKISPTISVEKEKKEKDRPKKATFKEKQEFSVLEKEIEQLESEKKTLEEELSSGTLDGQVLLSKSQRISQIIDLLDEKTMRWLELSELI